MCVWGRKACADSHRETTFQWWFSDDWTDSWWTVETEGSWLLLCQTLFTLYLVDTDWLLFICSYRLADTIHLTWLLPCLPTPYQTKNFFLEWVGWDWNFGHLGTGGRQCWVEKRKERKKEWRNRQADIVDMTGTGWPWQTNICVAFQPCLCHACHNMPCRGWTWPYSTIHSAYSTITTPVPYHPLPLMKSSAVKASGGECLLCFQTSLIK